MCARVCVYMCACVHVCVCVVCVCVCVRVCAHKEFRSWWTIIQSHAHLRLMCCTGTGQLEGPLGPQEGEGEGEEEEEGAELQNGRTPWWLAEIVSVAGWCRPGRPPAPRSS